MVVVRSNEEMILELQELIAQDRASEQEIVEKVCPHSAYQDSEELKQTANLGHCKTTDLKQLVSGNKHKWADRDIISVRKVTDEDGSFIDIIFRGGTYYLTKVDLAEMMRMSEKEEGSDESE